MKRNVIVLGVLMASGAALGVGFLDPQSAPLVLELRGPLWAAVMAGGLGLREHMRAFGSVGEGRGGGTPQGRGFVRPLAAPASSAASEPVTLATLNTRLQFRGALLVQQSQQTIANAVETKLTWGALSLVYGITGIWSSVQPGRLTVPAGVTAVRIVGGVTWEAALATGRRNLAIFKNGARTNQDGTLPEVTATQAASTQTFCMNIVSPVLVVTPGDYFELAVLYADGGTSTRTAGLPNPTFFALEVVQ